MTEDRLERYAREGVHGARLAINLERARPSGVLPWEDRTDEQREQDRRAASAVAAMAVHDAALQSHEDGMELARFRAHLPVILDALRIAEASGGYEYERKRYRHVLEALGDSEEEAANG